MKYRKPSQTPACIGSCGARPTMPKSQRKCQQIITITATPRQASSSPTRSGAAFAGSFIWKR